MRLILIVVCLLAINACTSLAKPRHSFCNADQEQRFQDFCKPQTWLDVLLRQHDVDWSQKRAKIDKLSDSPRDKLHKILLTHDSRASYKRRLQATIWSADIAPFMHPRMQDLLLALSTQLNQLILQQRSEISLLRRQRATLIQQNERYQQTLNDLESQIEALLKVEASLMKKEEGSR